jgi:hypothetical protein
VKIKRVTFSISNAALFGCLQQLTDSRPTPPYQLAQCPSAPLFSFGLNLCHHAVSSNIEVESTSTLDGLEW